MLVAPRRPPRPLQEDFSTGIVSARRLANGVPAGLLIVLNQTRQAFAKYGGGVGRWLLPRVATFDQRASQCSSWCRRTVRSSTCSVEEVVVRTRRYGNVLARKAFGRELYIVVETKTVGLIESYGESPGAVLLCGCVRPMRTSSRSGARDCHVELSQSSRNPEHEVCEHLHGLKRGRRNLNMAVVQWTASAAPQCVIVCVCVCVIS